MLNKNLKIIKNQKGFTLTELLVSIGIFASVSAAIMTFAGKSFENLSMENRASSAALELQNALALISTELRMSGAASPYLPGTTLSLTKCTSALAVTATTIKFLVTQDESAGSYGIKKYYVGYKYDAVNKQLLRGEIVSTSIYNCTVPLGDPTSNVYAKVIADNIVQIDSNSNGVLDSVFTLSGNSLVINLGIEIDGKNGMKTSQDASTQIYLRTN